MLEQAKFSLARAGVMVGLCGFVVLGAGWFLNSREAVKTKAPVHFSVQTWQGVQSVLRHVAPKASSPVLSLPQRQGAACAAGRSNHERLQKEVDVLNRHLSMLARTQFVKTPYQLDLPGMLQATAHMDRSCLEILLPIQWLNDRVNRQGLAFLQSLVWKERSSETVQARLEANTWVALPKQMLTSRSAWAGLPGCLYGTDAASGQRVLAGRADATVVKFCQTQAAGEQALRSPFTLSDHLPGLSSLTDPLSAWRVPQHTQYSERMGEDNQVLVAGQTQAVGLHVQLSIDPGWQAWLQQLAECFSGKASAACTPFATQAEGRYEKARVRMAGISVIDIPTGRVVAAASANSPCHAHDKTRAGVPPSDCPVLPEDSVHRPRLPQALTNHALLTQAPPGSLVKPLLMSGIVSYAVADADITGLDQAMQRSDSQRFLDAFLCRQKLGQGGFSARCDRPALAQQSAHRLGWNSGCNGLTDAALAQCGMVDLILGTPLVQKSSNGQRRIDVQRHAPVLPVLMGQTLVAPHRSVAGTLGYRDMSWPNSLPSTEQRKTCAQSGERGYVRCGGAHMGLISEAYGQGNTLATPVGVAGMLATLANSAQGQTPHYPHLLVDALRADGQSDPALADLQGAASQQGPEGIDSLVARRVLDSMEKTLMPGGTAHSACVRAFGLEGCRSPRGVAGKTGTPGDADERSLSQLAHDMRARTACRSGASTSCLAQYPLPRPRYRWYAAAFKSQGSNRYDKAIAVLVHSNWRRSDGRYADDQNAAAEMAMLAIRQFQTAQTKP